MEAREPDGFLLFRQPEAPFVPATPENSVLTPSQSDFRRARARRLPRYLEVLVPVTFAGKQGWSDSYMMAEGEMPYRPNEMRPVRDASSALRTEGELGEPVQWLGFRNDETPIFVGIKPDGTVVGIDPAYWGYFVKKYKNPEFLARGTNEAVIVRSNGEVVGAIMPMYVLDRPLLEGDLYDRFGVVQEGEVQDEMGAERS